MFTVKENQTRSGLVTVEAGFANLSPSIVQLLGRLPGQTGHVFVLSFTLLILWGAGQEAVGSIRTEIVASGLASPVVVTAPRDDPRLFIVEQPGTIRLLENDVLLPTPFLDIQDRVVFNPGSQGLLSLAFHPESQTNRHFFVSYTALDSSTVVERYEISAKDPNLADVGSAVEILRVPQPEIIHNGGVLAFGADGYLYIGMGDGGLLGDPMNFAQNPSSFLGKILRIDVDLGEPYAIPKDNPFVGVPGYLEEIWSLGVRNPWVLSFDRETGDQWFGDVGQLTWEEVNFAPSGLGGSNYGWRQLEGNDCFDPPKECEDDAFTEPIHVYDHSSGNCAILGGHVYRGPAIPWLDGSYFFMDFCSGRVFSLRYNGSEVTEVTDWTSALTPPSFFIFPSSISVGGDGELYIVELRDLFTNAGRVHRIVPVPSSVSLPTNEEGIGRPYPNPFVQNVRLTIRIDTAHLESAEILSLDGRRVRTLDLPSPKLAGASLRWDGRDSNGRAAPSGMYLCKVSGNGRTSVQKVHLLRE